MVKWAGSECEQTLGLWHMRQHCDKEAVLHFNFLSSYPPALSVPLLLNSTVCLQFPLIVVKMCVQILLFVCEVSGNWFQSAFTGLTCKKGPAVKGLGCSKQIGGSTSLG